MRKGLGEFTIRALGKPSVAGSLPVVLTFRPFGMGVYIGVVTTFGRPGSDRRPRFHLPIRVFGGRDDDRPRMFTRLGTPKLPQLARRKITTRG